MTDQTIPAGITPEEAKKAREWALHALNKPGASTTAEKAVARVVIGTVPEPRPTLADMTEDERDACQWMQADTKLWGRVVIIVPDLSDGRTALLDRSGDVIYGRYVNVTPRPDLPRLEWPGEKKPNPAPALPEGWRLADHKDHGRVIVTTPVPARDGCVYYVIPSDTDHLGFDWLFCHADELTYLEQEDDQ